MSSEDAAAPSAEEVANVDRPPAAPPAGPRARAAKPRTWTTELVDLSKARLNSLVVVASGSAFVLADPRVDVAALLAVVVGTALLAGSAAALNQLMEIDLDRRMHRTIDRPLVTGRLSKSFAIGFALVTGVAGFEILHRGANLLAALLALASLASYLALYTPLKRVTSLSTFLGAIPGALPPLIGWVGATGEIQYGGLVLFVILFLWQLPHFIAIGWIHREDYTRAGFPILSVGDADGSRSARHAFLTTCGVVIVSVSPFFAGIVTTPFLFVAPAVGLILLLPARRFLIEPNYESARRLFLSTLVYLPVLYGVMFALLEDPATRERARFAPATNAPYPIPNQAEPDLGPEPANGSTPRFDSGD